MMKLNQSSRASRFLWAALALGATLFQAEVHASDAQKKKLAFDTTATGSEIKEAVAQLPLLVRLHSGNFLFAKAKPDGSDLRFFAADGKTPLPFQIENFDATNELANIWVLVPKLSASAKSDSLVVAWGDEKAAPKDAKPVFDGTQILVYHFEGSEGVKDATPNANNAKASTAKPLAAGPIGAAMTFAGSDKIDVPASATLKISAAQGFTFNAWVKPAPAESGTLFALGGPKGLVIALNAGKPTLNWAGGSVTAPAALNPAAWQHVAVSAAGGKASIYVDGAEVANGNVAGADVAGDAVIGEGYRGDLDELGLAGAARSPAYIKALAASQQADSPMMSFAEDEAGGESVSYFAILIGSVTIDGWVVIALLAVMAVVSVYVMVSKSMLLSRAKKSNTAFLELFKNQPSELLTPGHAAIAQAAKDARFKGSSIFRLYSVGIDELQKRFDKHNASAGAFRLTANGLDAIRASLDAAMVREGQRLNSGIVLLTIAISGGPFLGLLGTVVGVMITFAAIAAAGDVNVNAIAPGIAAALVATVAGLGVAIPALFGYNWLASQIKNVSSDSQVFLDEFLTKSAELHAE